MKRIPIPSGAAPGLLACAALVLAACGAPDPAPPPETPPIAPDGTASDGAAAPPAAPLPPELADIADPPPLDLGQRYRQEIAGRWAERPGCMGMSWSFQAESFTTPGETHCAEIALEEGSGGAIRVAGRDCLAEGMDADDMTLDVRAEDGALTVTGVGNPVSTQGWPRCE